MQKPWLILIEAYTSKEVKWAEEIEKQPVQIPSKSGPRECKAARCVIPFATVCDALD